MTSVRRTPNTRPKKVLNGTTGQGLRQMPSATRPTVRFETRTVDLGECLLGNVDDVVEVLDIAEREPLE